jgi:uncharacterized repeat protein (TIGR01451 family)
LHIRCRTHPELCKSLTAKRISHVKNRVVTLETYGAPGKINGMSSNMKINNNRLVGSGPFGVSILLAMIFPPSAFCQPIMIPERIGVVDVIPNNQSGETNQNSEPSLAVGTGDSLGKFALVADGEDVRRSLFTSTGDGIQWTQRPDVMIWSNNPPNPSAIRVFASTIDWSAGGLAYLADEEVDFGYLFDIFTSESSDPSAGVGFSYTNSLFGAGPPAGGEPLELPHLTVVNANGADQIYIGYANFTNHPNKFARVQFSVNSGISWTTEPLDKITPGIADEGASVHIATSSDGATVYGIFERYQSNSGFDEIGDVVLVRDDLAGLLGFNSLPINGNGGNDGVNDTEVATNVVLPVSGSKNWQGTWLGSETLAGNDAIAVSPNDAHLLYVAYTEVVTNTPIIRVQQSGDGGQTFQLVYSTSVASSLPALAVAGDGTVGLLFEELSGINQEVHFLKAAKGDFTKTNEMVLSSFPDGDPEPQHRSYLGMFFQLRAVGDNFYGTFAASGQPLPKHFPSGVFYQRDVAVGVNVMSNFWLSTPGTLTNLPGSAVNYSIDPFFFYDIAPVFIRLPVLEYRPIFFIDPSDPLHGTRHMGWPVLPPSYPQYRLEGSLKLGPGANWLPPSDLQILQNNGKFYASMGAGPPARFFRVSQDVASGQFNIFSATGGNGNLDPLGILPENGLQTQSFTATPNRDYAFKQWFLDGVAVPPPANPTLILSNIGAEHTVLATFAPVNDIAVTLGVQPPLVQVNSNFNYVVRIQNTGIAPVTNVRLTNTLPATVSFVSVMSSQGIVGQTSPGVVTGDFGVLNPGDLARVTIMVTANSVGSITDVVNAACSEFEPDLANNAAEDIRNVILPVTITNQPVSQSVPVGGTASFTVGGSGSAPINYEWFFNGALIPNATNDVLTLTNVTATQAGSYSARLFQFVGFKDQEFIEADSTPATLMVTP